MPDGTTRHRAAPGRRIPGLLRGLAALAVLGFLIFGLPALLYIVAGSPIPARLPGLDEVVETLRRRDDGTILLGVIKVVTWVAWAAFVAVCSGQVVCQIRGRSMPRFPGLGSLQAMVGRLVATVALTIGPGSASALAATPPPPAVLTSTAQPPASPAAASQAAASQAAPSGEAAGPAAEHTGVHRDHAAPRSAYEPPRQDEADPRPRTVKRGDTLWDISEEEYGTGLRYTSIYQASRRVDQPDGVPDLRDPDSIHPGMRLVVPANAGEPADDREPDPPPPRRPPPEDDRQRGDRGEPDGGAAPPPARRPGGAPTETSRPAPTASATGSARPSPSATGPAAPPSAGESGRPAPPPSGTGSAPPPSGTGQSSSGTGSATAPSGAGSARSAEEEELSTARLVGFGALLAAAVLALLGAKRLLQQRRRRPGRRISLPETMSDTELAMRVHEEPADIELLDRALRSLSAEVARAGEILPALIGARVSATDVELLPLEPARPPPPFATSGDLRWRLERDGPPPEGPGEEIPAPYPALVTLGDDGDGAHVLVDLTTFGTITLGGAPADVREVLTAMAIELATSPWADHILVTCVGFAPELPRALGTGRLRHAVGLDEALVTFEARAAEVRDVLVASGARSVEDARTRQIAGDAWTPEIILSVEPLDAEESARIARLVTSTPRLNLGAVVPAPGAGAVSPPAACHLDAAPDRQVWLEPMGTDITLQRISEPRYRQLLDDLLAAGDTEGVPDPEWEHVPSEHRFPLPPLDDTPSPTGDEVGRSEWTVPLDALPAQRTHTPGTAETSPVPEHPPPPADEEEEAHDVLVWRGHVDPEIRVLGRVDVAGRDAGEIEPGKQNVLVELAAFLKLNPGCSAAEVSAAMGARQPWSASTRASNMSRLRAWLGRDQQGRNYVPAQGEGRLYTMLDSVRCDWETFRSLARRGLAEGKQGAPGLGVPALRGALDLVRGRPFSGAGPANYGWAEHLKQHMLSTIVDVAHALATRLIEMGDPAGARTAIAKGLQIEPGSELLYRDLFRAEHRAGNAVGIDAAAERLMITLYELDLEMEPETAELLEQLRTPRRRTS